MRSLEAYRQQPDCRGSQLEDSPIFTLGRDLLDEASAQHGANDTVAGGGG
jgi:hypothetical protein